MTNSNILGLAKQGDPAAIAAMLNHSLQPKGVSAKAAVKDGSLQIMLEAAQVPDRDALVDFVHQGIKKINSDSISSVRVYGRKIGDNTPAWKQDIFIDSPLDDFSSPNFNQELSEMPADEEEMEEVGLDEPPAKAKSADNSLLKKLAVPLIILLVAGGGYFAFTQWQAMQEAEAPPEVPATPVVKKPKTPAKSPVAAAPQKAGTPANPAASPKAGTPAKPAATPKAATKPPAATPKAATKPPAAATKSEPWKNGVSKAVSAATLTQTAKSSEEWNVVIADWEAAIASMKQVPKNNPNYAIAQKKVSEYERNLAYAKQRANKK